MWDERAQRTAAVTSLVFDDFDAMENAVAMTTATRYYRRSTGKFEGRLLRTALGDCTLQVGSHSTGFLSCAAVDPGVYGLLVTLDASGPCCANGHADAGRGVLLYRPGGEHFAHASGAISWVYLSLPAQSWPRFAATIAGSDGLAISDNCRFLQPRPETLAVLQNTLRRALQVLQTTPGALDEPTARQNLQQTLLGCFARAIADADGMTDDGPRPRISQTRVVCKAQDFLEANLHAAVYINELCAATGVSERTLRNAFRKMYGVGPNSYLKLRRLNQVHRLLKRNDAPQMTVTEAATRCGFWDMSRFAVEYRALFGQTPSQTLRSAEK
jgi:AraC-like DNA-binding protein